MMSDLVIHFKILPDDIRSDVVSAVHPMRMVQYLQF